MARTAFVGLGVMGYPMAGHLVKHGHEVAVFNRTYAKAEAWAAEYGGRACRTPCEAAAGAELVIAAADVRLSADAVEDPLAHVASQMQAEVADGVGRVRGAAPDLLLVEPVEAGVDAGEILAQLGDREFEKDLFRSDHEFLGPW